MSEGTCIFNAIHLLNQSVITENNQHLIQYPCNQSNLIGFVVREITPLINKKVHENNKKVRDFRNGMAN